MRIISLIPSATEIICALGEEENFVNVPGFSKVFYNQEGVQNQLLYNTAMPLAHICCSKINVEIETIYYGRSFLQVPLQDKSGLSNPHIDITNFDHLVCLYYVFDSDGDTVVFKEKFNLYKNQKLSISKRIKPKKEKVINFNGFHWHTSCNPLQNNFRIVMNVNYVV